MEPTSSIFSSSSGQLPEQQTISPKDLKTAAELIKAINPAHPEKSAPPSSLLQAFINKASIETSRLTSLSSRELQETSTQIKTILQFIELHSLPSQKTTNLLEEKMLSSLARLAIACANRISDRKAKPQDIKPLCKLIHDAVKTCSSSPVTISASDWVDLAQILNEIVTDKLEKLLTEAQVTATTQAVNSSATKEPLPTDRLHEAIGTLSSTKKLKLYVSKPSEEKEAPAVALHYRSHERVPAGIIKGLLSRLKNAIADLFGRVGHSKESQLASRSLLNDMEDVFKDLNKQGKTTFFNECIEPLTHNAWFQGTLRNNRALKTQFNRIKERVANDLIREAMEDLKDQLEQKSAPNYLATMNALKETFTQLAPFASDKRNCPASIASIDRAVKRAKLL